MKIYEIDKKIGLFVYSTPEKGIGGILRKKISDFKVQEINTNMKIMQFYSNNENYNNIFGKKLSYLNFNLQKYNLSTFEAIRKLSALTGIDINNFYFSGLKDKRGITVQKIAVKGNPIEKLLKLNEKNIKIFNFNKGQKIFEGDHWGNYFIIKIRNVTMSEYKCVQTIKNIWNNIREFGLINYFGYQRFGVIRPITHLIGKALFKNQFELAIKIYLTLTTKYENKTISKIREDIKRDWPDIDRKFINKLPDHLYYEKEILNKIINNKLSFQEIFNSVFNPRLVRLFFHAYQGFVYNKILSYRIRKYKRNIEIGDYIIILDYFKLPTNKIVKVDSNNYETLKKLVKNRKAVLGIPLINKKYLTQTNLYENYQIKKIIKEEKLELSDIKTIDNYFLSLKERFRPVFIYPQKFQFHTFKELNKNLKLNIEMKFLLPKGSYATILLREFMKTDPINY